jgi:mono/diheme cytochrome c family protein
MKRWGMASAMVTIMVYALGAASARAQPYSGSSDYQLYCVSCHGVDARGDGVIAKSLKKRPADLTQISQRSGGVFPDEKVFKAIDGRQPAHAHNATDMPAWGEVLAKSSGSVGAENAAARIEALVKYLQTLQAK